MKVSQIIEELKKAKDEEDVSKKDVPKKDGSGQGKRLNRGRSGCAPTRSIGKGREKIKGSMDDMVVDYIKKDNK